MKKILRWFGRILVALVLAAVVVGVWKREELVRVWTVITLFDEDKIVGNFHAMGSAFLTVPLRRGEGPASPLPEGTRMTLPASAESWITDRNVTSLLVLKGGEIRFEDYYLGTAGDDLRISWSIAKSYLSALLGVLVDEGAITSLDDPVTKYVPELEGSGYDGASLRNVLNMSSGVVFNEDYLDFNSDIQRMGRIVALGGRLDDFTASFPERFAEPGEVWKYVSIDTHVIGMVIRGATGRAVSELMEEKLIRPLGLEQDGLFITDGDGTAFVLGGLNFTTRDYARFGVMIEQDGEYANRRVVSADWIARSTAPNAPPAQSEGFYRYGYQWWIPEGAAKGEFVGRGIYGQYLYIDQRRDVVIVVTAADRAFRTPGRDTENIETLRQIANSL